MTPADDFEISGTGETVRPGAASSGRALRRRQPDGHPYDSRFKMLYSTTGLYFLMEGTDRTLTATMNEDFMDLWKEDVFEVFLWTDERFPVYFEYEISPLDRELPILIPNFGGRFLGWRPWHYERDRQTRKATSIIGGPKQSQAAIQGWRAEFFIPYALLIAAAERAARSRAVPGARTSTGWTTTAARRRSGSGRRSATVSTNTRSSAIWCSRIDERSRVFHGRSVMWSRRRFLEIVSGLPVVGGSSRRTAAAAAQRAAKAGARLFPRARRASLHQCGRHLHGHDRVADAA